MGGMNKTIAQFQPQQTKNDRWFVSVKTGNGPDSQLGTSKRQTRREIGFRTNRNTGPANQFNGDGADETSVERARRPGARRDQRHAPSLTTRGVPEWPIQAGIDSWQKFARQELEATLDG
jgi:hypothetical protein